MLFIDGRIIREGDEIVTNIKLRRTGTGLLSIPLYKFDPSTRQSKFIGSIPAGTVIENSVLGARLYASNGGDSGIASWWPLADDLGRTIAAFDAAGYGD